MAPAKRHTPAELDHARAIVAQQYLRGYTQAEIAAEQGVTQQTISLDLAVIRKEWRESAISDYDALVDRELAKVDLLEREFWEAWERSQEPHVRTRTARRGRAATTSETRTPRQEGDPRFLEGVLKCIAMRCKVLGVEAPSRFVVAHAEPYDPITNETRVALLLSAYLDRSEREDHEQAG